MDAKEVLTAKSVEILGDIAQRVGGGPGSNQRYEGDALVRNGDGNAEIPSCGSAHSRYLRSSNHAIDLSRDRRVAAVESERDIYRYGIFQSIAGPSGNHPDLRIGAIGH